MESAEEGGFANRQRGFANRTLNLQIGKLFWQIEYQSANRWIGPANREADSANRILKLANRPAHLLLSGLCLF
ncbi:hypothetical protein LG298_03875 [Cytobacillus firmus]|uniref:hypothetical protein n=1 Tax=Cytobacillus firmus TaxID=1399 RepID=UPI00384FC00F